MNEALQPNSVVAVCQRLAIPLDVARLANMARRVARPGVSIAVVGLLSRGKSTLVNEIIGVELCKVSAIPETAAVVSASRGPRSAVGRRRNGAAVDLPNDPTAFRSALARSAQSPIDDAEYVGDLRIPFGISIIDTPGIDEARMGQDADLTRLQSTWSESGADAAIHVLSVPPGAATADLRLLQAARETFDGNVQVVLKAIDSNVDADDLEAVAEQLRRDVDLDALVLSGAADHAAWRQGRLSHLEAWVDHTASVWSSSRAMDQAELDEIIHEISRDIGLLGDDRLEALESVAVDLSSVPESIASAIIDRVTALRAVLKARVTAAADHDRAKLVEFLDDSARILGGRLPDGLGKADTDAHSSTYRELVRLAHEGSRVAARAVRSIFAAHEKDRLRLGLSFASTLAAIPDEHWNECLDGVALTAEEVVEVARVSRSRLATLPVVRNAVLSNCRRKSTAAQVGILLGEVHDPELHRQLELLHIEQVFAEFTAAGLAWTECDESSFHRARDIAHLADNLPTNHLSAATARQNAGRVNELKGWISDVACSSLNGHVGLLTASPVLNTHDWQAGRALGHAVADWAWTAKPGPNADLARRTFARGGPLDAWAERSRAEVQRSQGAAIAARRSWRVIHGVSFGGWALSVAMLGSDPGAAVTLWLVSLVVWLVARGKKDVLPDWRSYYMRPSIPVESEAPGPASGARPVVLSPPNLN